MYRNLILAAFVLLVGGWSLLAEEELFVRSREKSVKGSLVKESPKGVDLGKESFSANDILDVQYTDLKPINIRTGSYRPAVKAEKDSLDPANDAKRKGLLSEAIKKYEETLKGMDATEKSAKRHIEFKLAILAVRQAREAGGAADAALQKLKAFADKNKDAWQYGASMMALGQFQADQKQFDDAIATFRSLATNDGLVEEQRTDADLAAIQAKINAGKVADARTDVSTLAKSIKPDSKYGARVQMAEAEILLAENKPDEAIKLARAVIKDSNDRSVKAIAHNTIGYCLFKSENLKDARWEFLWVDVVYNQDKMEHAKALYYLSRIFAQLGEGERAQECVQALQNDRAFAGMEWQARAVKEAKAP